MLKASLCDFGRKTRVLEKLSRDTDLRLREAARQRRMEAKARDVGANLKNPTHVAAAFRRVALVIG